MNEEYLTTAEVAAHLRTAPSTCRYWRATNTGPAGFRVGRRVLYRRSEVDAWIRARELAERERRPA